ncbi:MAG: TatD family hydrolase [Deltaproteobacteria bacterium]|jgi:TatD DNase family protein|nr:TatD family hydrolase [Deltaproteobacteria bacterium]MBW2486602.1 TatD family hydrolase [Deltaproteobacteria bacterium]MBW2515636.1 TatD family hydrolase [Deltaproteobacteria bacterium]
MKLFDSHCHLDDKSYRKDLVRVIERARQAGIARMMTIGVNKKTAARALEIAESHPDIYASVGYHPHDAGQCNADELDFLTDLAQNPRVRAWGEIGLDYNRMYSPREDQEKWFVRQLQIAAQLKLPLIFHERDTGGRFLEILKAEFKTESGGVVHCFSGTLPELEQYINLGLTIGITGILTLRTRGADLREMVPHIPADRLVVETDAPYLTPAPEKYHTRRNEPAFVKFVLLKLAEVRNEDPEQLAQTIWDNTNRLYRID